MYKKTKKIVGMGVCGAGEADRYMEATLKEFKRLCDDVIIATCNATQKEKDLISKYGFWQYEDNREWGIDQPNIKSSLLEKVSKLKPDWIIALDMDEIFPPEFTREEAEKLTNSDEIAYQFLVVNLYNDKDHFAHDVGIQRFWNVRFFKHCPEYGYTYIRKNLHCGLAPPIFYRYAWHAPFYLEHYGLMKEEDRIRRVQRYDRYDPNAKFKGREYYDDLKKKLEPREFDRKGLLAKLKEAPECKKRITPRIND